MKKKVLFIVPCKMDFKGDPVSGSEPKLVIFPPIFDA
jgi:hypothetical protein